MIIRVAKSYGNAFINLVRQLLIANTKEYRPIAFRVGDASNVLAISDAVEEDMTEFISKFCRGNFVATGEKELTTVRLQCANTLQMLSVKNEDVTFAGEDSTVLHSFSPIEAEVVFRYGTGSHTVDENEAFLREHGIDTGKFVCVCSRHSLVENFSYSMEEAGDEMVYDVSVVCKPGVTEKSVMGSVMSALTELIGSLK